MIGERRTPALFVAGAVGTWVALMVPAFVSSPTAWKASWQAYFHGADIGSAWLMISQVGNVGPVRVRTTLLTPGPAGPGRAVVVALARRAAWSFARLGVVWSRPP